MRWIKFNITSVKDKCLHEMNKHEINKYYQHKIVKIWLHISILKNTQWFNICGNMILFVLQEKRRLYEEQQKKMENRQVSFLDSIRAEYDDY